MALLACPKCDGRVSVPDGVRTGVEITCPHCGVIFLMPAEAARPKPKTAVRARTDYLDAEDFTPDDKPKKPKAAPLVVSGPVTVAVIIGAVAVASAAGGFLVYSTLKAQNRIAPTARKPPPAEAPAPPPAAAPAFLPVPAEPHAAPLAEVPLPPPFPQPGDDDEAWALLLGTWTLVGKPAVDPLDEPSPKKLVFAADKSAVVTCGQKGARGAGREVDDPHAVARVVAARSGVTVRLRPKAAPGDRELQLRFETRDRIEVRHQAQEGGRVYLLRFARGGGGGGDGPAFGGPAVGGPAAPPAAGGGPARGAPGVNPGG